MPELDLLRTFLSVYRAGTFTQAAAELHLSQPTVSQHIKSLEAQVGRQLFRRVASRGIVPTAAGMELAQGVAQHVDALESMVATGAADGGGVGDTVFIGGPAEFMSVRVIPTLADLIADGLRVRMYFDVDAPVVERLANGDIDMAVLTAEWRRRGLEVDRLCFEYLELVAAPHWRDEIGELPTGPAGARRLRDVPVLAYDEDLPLVAHYWREVFDTRARLRAGAVANSLRAMLTLAIDGAGITVLPSHVCAAALERGELVRLHELERPPRNQLYLAWRAGLRGSALASAHARLVEAARGW